MNLLVDNILNIDYGYGETYLKSFSSERLMNTTIKGAILLFLQEHIRVQKHT